MYLIYYNGVFWKENKKGYSNNILDAGLYIEQEAKSIEKGGRGDRAINLADKDIQEQIQEELEICERRINNSKALIIK